VLVHRDEHARRLAEQARAAADQSTADLDAHARHIRDRLLHQWQLQHEHARRAGQVVLAGPGRLGHHALAMHRATETLATWSTSWQPYLSDMPTGTTRIAHFALYASNGHWITDALDRYAHAQAEHGHPEHRDLLRAADAAEQQWQEIRRENSDRRGHLDAQLTRYGALGYAHDLPERLQQVDQHISDAKTRLERVNRRLDRLSHEPAIAAQPPGWLQTQHERWKADDAAEAASLQPLTDPLSHLAIDAAGRERLHSPTYEHHATQHDMGRHGPSFGR
jgi:hypothetical protein